jgi:CubicO group peptidase (beta-lactamase class C family)
MNRLLVIALAALAALIVWVGLVGVGARYGWLRPAVAARGDTAGFMRWAERRYEHRSRGDIVIVMLEHGRPVQTWAASHDRTVDQTSLFQVASLSKWITAWGVMTLVEQRKIDLDAPVSRYLTRWRLPPSAYDNNQVTVRRLLSHTAGLTDGLGFLGYPPNQAPPTIEQELTRTRDGQPGAAAVRMGAAADGTWRYSGGGYLILQLLIEEVSHEPFNAYMRRAVLQPLGMTQSTFVDPDPAHLAEHFGARGETRAPATYTAVGAASLFTSADDLTRFLQAQRSGGGVLKAGDVAAMRTPTAFLYGFPVWGLGQALYAPDGAGGYVVGHDGGNAPAINTTARIDPATGDGLIVLETGNPTLAAEIGGTWTWWTTGVIPLDTLVLFEARGVLILLGAGAAMILMIAMMVALMGRRPQ